MPIPAGSETVSLDVITYQEGLDAITVSTGSTTINSDSLALMITGVSRLLDRRFGPIVKRTITGERHSGGNNTIVMYQRPIDSITTCTEWWFNTPHVLLEEIPGAQHTFQYSLDGRKGMLYRREVGWDMAFWPGRRNVIVDYVAGRFTDTESVDQLFKEAASITLASVWRPQFGMRGPDAGPPVASFALPNAAEEILSGELLGDLAGIG